MKVTIYLFSHKYIQPDIHDSVLILKIFPFLMEECTYIILRNLTKGKTKQTHHYAKMCYLGIRAKSYMTGTPEFQSPLKYLLMSFLQADKICQNQKVS